MANKILAKKSRLILSSIVRCALLTTTAGLTALHSPASSAVDRLYAPALTACSNVFSDPNCWQGGVVPDAVDNVYFNTAASSPYTVYFTAPATSNNGTFINIDKLIWDLGSNSYSLNADLTAGEVTGDAAELQITNGTVSNDRGFIGRSSGATGAVQVTGSSTNWNNAGNLNVGQSGNGALTIDGGGSVSNVFGVVGRNAGSSGTATVSGQASNWTNSNNLTIGSSGTGTLSIDSGGTVSNLFGYLGRNANSSGTATVSGMDAATGLRSTWGNGSDLYVGRSGTGILRIENGGTVNNTAGLVGSGTAGNGTVIVNGVDTTTGQRSSWDNRGDLYVGRSGTGILRIENGGYVNNAFGYVGRNTGSSGDVTIGGVDTGSGQSATWDNRFGLYIGGSTTTDGGTGNLSINTGGVVNVANTTKVWSNGTLSLYGGSLTTRNFDSSLGVLNFRDGTLTVNGSTGTFVDGNTSLSISSVGPGQNPTLVLSNRASADYSSGNAYIGGSGTGTLVLDNGGTANNITGYLGSGSSSNGYATVTGVHAGSGQRSSWNNSGDLIVGDRGDGTLTIGSGGMVTSSAGYLGRFASTSGSGNGTATVSGVDATTGLASTWNNSNTLIIGERGDGTLIIDSGGMVTSSAGYLGRSTSSTGNSSGTATVSGIDATTGQRSTWDNNGNLYIGQSGDGTLTIDDGGSVVNTSGVIASGSGSRSAATVSGVNTGTGQASSWMNTNTLTVGSSGIGTLGIDSGGSVISTAGAIGYASGSRGTATVSGVDAATGQRSSWANSNSLTIGQSGIGTLTIDSGGSVSSVDGYLGRFTDGRGTVTVSGVDAGTGQRSSWDNSGDLIVGDRGVGTLTIGSGGMVSNTTGFIGLRRSGSVTVSGGDAATGQVSTWRNNDSLYIGGTATSRTGNGTLTISDGGQVDVSNQLKVWTASTANLSDAALSTGTLNNQGQVIFNGGNSTVSGAVSNESTGRVTVSNNATAIFNGDVVHNGNDFRVEAGSSAVFNGAVSGARNYTGTGSLFFEDVLNPGNNSTALIDIGGDVFLGNNNSTLIELGGLARGLDYDAFDIVGSLSLSGELDVSLFDPGSGLFSPALGNSFDLFTAENILGDFDLLTLAALDDGLNWQLETLIDVTGTTDILRLSVVNAVPVPASVWLFGSGLLGLVGVARRRSSGDSLLNS